MKRRNFALHAAVAGLVPSMYAKAALAQDAPAASQPDNPFYKAVGLGRFQGGRSGALALNNQREAAGYVYFNIQGGYRPALFQLGEAPKPIYTDGPGEATGINSRTETVGWFRQGSFTQAFRWWRGQLTTLPSLGGGNSFATGINNRSEVVGWSEAAPGVSHATYWWRDKLTDLGTWGGYAAQATAINERGDILGFREMVLNGVGVRQGVLLSVGRKPQLLPIPAGYDSLMPTALNNRGDVTGYVYNTNDYLWSRRAFIYTDNKCTLLPAVGAYFPTGGLCINNQRVMGGFRFDGNADPRDGAIAWLDKGKTPVLPYAGWWPRGPAEGWYRVSSACAINEEGAMVGTGRYLSSYVYPGIWFEAYMLIPKN
ncbi:hypothetical protein [Azohydromonas aeria]|uniref:hypothetical protein n=1 Tax=Azohydromonas aeria TaxID=2590212 RepID=UPI0012F96CCB|nr:hypothetical protein [Azohydromonas aeria]